MDLGELLKKRDKELRDARSLIDDLTEQLQEYEDNDVTLALSDSEKRMLKIIEKEMERLEKDVNEMTLDTSDLKKFDTLVKDFVAIRGKMPATKKSDKSVADTDEHLADLVALAKG